MFHLTWWAKGGNVQMGHLCTLPRPRVHVQVAVDPRALVVYSRLHAGCELVVQDSSSLCAEGEEVNFLALQLRAQSVGQVCTDLAGSAQAQRVSGSPDSAESNLSNRSLLHDMAGISLAPQKGLHQLPHTFGCATFW